VARHRNFAGFSRCDFSQRLKERKRADPGSTRAW
jgi:hypothetical protein